MQEEVLDVLKQTKVDFEDKKDYNRKKKAKKLQALLVLLFYTSLPPLRGLEISTLQIDESLVWREATCTWFLVINQYKGAATKGQDFLELDATTQAILIKYLELFINEHRPVL